MSGEKRLNSTTNDETERFVEMTARRRGWEVNGGESFRRRLIEGLTKNYNRYGYYHCPCRDSWDGNREKDADIICPCWYSVADLQDYGHCLCGLYLSQEFGSSGKPVRSIPERRHEGRFP